MFPSPFRTLRPALLGLLLPVAAAAQTPAPAPADTARFYKHHLGLTASPVLDGFFRNNRSLPLGLLYKRQLTPNKALRLRLVGQYSYADSTNSTEGPFGVTDGYVSGPSTRFWQLAAFVGYVWQHPLPSHFTLDYGLEVGIGYVHQVLASAYRSAYQPGGFVVQSYERTTQNFQLQARPFAGLSYYFTPRLRLFAETALPLTYTHQRWERHGTEVFTKSDEAERFLDQYARSNRVTIIWRPIQFLGATYAF